MTGVIPTTTVGWELARLGRMRWVYVGSSRCGLDDGCKSANGYTNVPSLRDLMPRAVVFGTCALVWSMLLLRGTVLEYACTWHVRLGHPHAVPFETPQSSRAQCAATSP